MTDHDQDPDPDPADGTEAEPEESAATHSTSKRWWLTNDGLAWLLVGSFPALVGIAAGGVIDISLVPQAVLYTWLASVGAAVAWTFGSDAVEAWRGGSGGGPP